VQKMQPRPFQEATYYQCGQCDVCGGWKPHIIIVNWGQCDVCGGWKPHIIIVNWGQCDVCGGWKPHISIVNWGQCEVCGGWKPHIIIVNWGQCDVCGGWKPHIIIVNWGQCDVCGGWVHLASCTPVRVVRRGTPLHVHFAQNKLLAIKRLTVKTCSLVNSILCLIKRTLGVPVFWLYQNYSVFTCLSVFCFY